MLYALGAGEGGPVRFVYEGIENGSVSVRSFILG